MLTGYAPAGVPGETESLFELRDAWRHGRLWVALADHVPVGFAHVVVRETGAAHLEELDVHPEHDRRGVGRQLVSTVCAWLKSSREPELEPRALSISSSGSG